MTETTLDSLWARLDRCMLADRTRLRRRLRGLRRGRGRGGARQGRRTPPQPEVVAQIASQLDASIERCERRRAKRPRPTFPDELPIAAKRDEIAAAIEANQVVVVCGETGSGKTTQLPKICLELGRGAAGVIGHTQPRRIAARSVAARIAEELGEPLGGSVGYKVRFNDRTGRDCLVKILTDGMLLAETQGDRRLDQYDTIIVDEAHERSLNIDFLLGYLERLRHKRPELKIIVTSATIDPHRFSEHFGAAPVVEVSGRTYPVEVVYQPPRPTAAGMPDTDMQRAILDGVDHVAALGRGDVLVFLPGEREIRETAEALRKHHPPHTEILPLYARLSAQEQNRVFQPHKGRRIVLATNVAETSLTVPGIRYVVDPGMARISRYSARRKVQLLPVETVSQASAAQRSGRCGRVAEGVCVRLYDESDFEKRPRYTDPEIQRTNLASVILRMHALDLGEVESFPFLDPPRKGMVRDGYDTLHELGALDDENRLTDLGRRLAALPVDPRLGRMILEADREDCLTEVLVIAAALSVPDPRERPLDRQQAADEAHEAFADERSDFLTYLKLWAFWHEQRKHLSWSKLRRACVGRFINFVRMREWIDIHQQLRRLVTESGMHPNKEPAEPDAIHRALLSGLLSNIALRKEGKEYRGSGDKVVHLFPGSGLYAKPPQWMMAAELVETTRLYARSAARIQPQWLEPLAGHLVQRTYSDPRWDPHKGRAVADERVTLFGLTIVSGRVANFGPVDPAAARGLFILHGLVERELRTDGAFLEHNRTLIDEIETLQAKSRKRDVLVDASVQYAFYDEHVPADVNDAREFERWRHRVEKRSPELLFMTREALMKHAAESVTAEQFPDAIPMNGLLWKLEYRLEPGHPEDGVTIVAPLEAIHHLDARRMEWLVPGRLRDKIVGLIRTLPKTLRRNFVPAPDFADACLERMPFGDGVLVERLAAELTALTGLEVPRHAWDLASLPEHLLMNVRVVDGQGEVLLDSRDLDEVRHAVGAEARTAFAEAGDDRFSCSGRTQWDFDDLPEQVDVHRQGMVLTGRPVVFDEGKTVGVRVIDEADVAERTMRAGLRRLLLLQIPGEIEYHLESLPRWSAMLAQAAVLGPVERFRDEMARLVADRVFLAGGELPRDAVAFERCLDAGYPNIWQTALLVGDIVGNLLDQHHRLQLAFDRPIPPQWDAAVADIRAHAARLITDRMLVDTQFEWLAQVPRYLEGCRTRLEKLGGGGHVRDARQMEQMRPYLEQYLERHVRHVAQGTSDPALEQYRWMLEEMCVSLYAQELGTAIQVSFKRLARQWEQVRR